MNRILLSIAAIVLTVCAFAQPSVRPDKVMSVYGNYMVHYPQSTLQDFYKFCFQDYFGPGHIITDRAAAERYLESEIASTSIFGGPLYEYCGLDGNYVRVNLSLVADSVIASDVLLDSFVRSASSNPLSRVMEWPACWTKIKSSLPDALLATPESKAFLSSLDEVFARGEFAFHHSRRFNDVYNFHYRIVERRIFEQSILPLIVGRYGIVFEQ